MPRGRARPLESPHRLWRFQPHGNPPGCSRSDAWCTCGPFPRARFCCPCPGRGTTGRSACLASPRRLRGLPLYAADGLLGSTGQALPWCPVPLSAHAIPATPEGPDEPGSCGGSFDPGLPLTSTGSAPSVSSRGYRWVRCTLRPARLRAPRGRSSGTWVLWVTPHTSLTLPGRLCHLPGPDFHRQVSQYPRHADGATFVTFNRIRPLRPHAISWPRPSRVVGWPRFLDAESPCS